MSVYGTFVIRDGVLEEYRGSAPVVTIPEGVREIGEGVFMHCRDLKEILFPAGLTHVGNFAFSDCRNLTAALLPTRTVSIGESAFSNCAELTTLLLPPGLKRIGYRAFYGCGKLERFRFPGKLERLGDQAFRGCSAMADGDGLVIAGGVLFDCVAGPDVTVPEGVTAISSAAFAFNKTLTRAVLPRSLRRIGGRAFMGCSSLEEVLLPEGLEAVENEVFWDCPSLRRVDLPRSLKRLGTDVFSGCRGLADEDGYLIRSGVLCGYFGGREAVTVPEGVTRIGAQAFEAGPGILHLRLPDSLESVSPVAFAGGDLILRTRRWVPELDRALEECRVRALSTEDAALVPPKLRRAFRLGLFLAPEKELDAPEAREAAEWLSKNAGSLCREAFEMPGLLRFLCERRLIPSKDLDAWMDAAGACGSPELTALLLEYQSALGWETVEKSRARKRSREEAALEARALRAAARRPEDGIAGLRVAAEGPLKTWETRQALQDWLEARGAVLSRTVTGKTDLMLTNDPQADSERLRKAAALGIPALSEEELLAMAREAE